MDKPKKVGIQAGGISVVIPAYNAEAWIRPTYEKLQAALTYANLNNIEVIIVDDGSSDNTKAEAESVAASAVIPVKVLSHPNAGRFLTRKRGVEAAKYENILFIDTRVWIDETSLAFVVKQQEQLPERNIWNGHVNVAKKGNIIARFGDAITLIGWRRYFSRPRTCSFDIKNFDYFPKGTGFFLVPKEIITKSIEWFESVTIDIKNSSDDTLLIRDIARNNRIWLSPHFSCTYFARTTLKSFMNHTYFRGQFFVDGFLRPGTRFFYPLLIFIVATPVLLVGLLLRPGLTIPLVFGLFLLWLAEGIGAILLKVNYKDALSLWLLSPMFATAYAAGIWRGVIRRLLQ